MKLVSQKITVILDTIKYMTIATVSGDGQPWSTPVAGFHFKNDTTLYWASWTENQHSKNISNNKRIFISVYDSTPSHGKPAEALYLLAEAFELSDAKEIMHVARELFRDDPYNPSDGQNYIGSKPRRIYKAIPQKIWTNGDKEIDGDIVDVRLESEP